MLVRRNTCWLEDAMKTVREVNSLEELEAVINEDIAATGLSIKKEDISFEYCGFDDRINWDTYYIHIRNEGIWGMSNGAIR